MCKGDHSAQTAPGKVWLVGDEAKPVASDPSIELYRPDILDHVEQAIDGLSEDLRALSLDIHGKL